MTPIVPKSAIRRVFACWPSRLGAAALLALGLSWGFAVSSHGGGPLLEASLAASR